jgi:hypothetical protein
VRLAPPVLLALGAACISAPLLALGKPDWAKPFLLEPTPTGPYIAKSDPWVVVHAEVVVGIQAGRFLELRQRAVLENLSDRAETFLMTIPYDEGQSELKDMALHVERVLWHEINLNRKAVKASVREQAQVILAGAEDIEPHRRVVFEYTIVDRLELTPWAVVEIPRQEPMARLTVSVDPAAAARGLKLVLQTPGDQPPPASFSRGEDGSWTITRVPAAGRMATRELVYQPDASELFPRFLAWLPGSQAESFPRFASFYKKAWDERAKTMDSSQLRAKAEALTAGAATAFERVSRLAGFVQREVLYDDSNATSSDAWLPLQTQETLRSLKADCKGKVMLLQGLLQAVGIESVPVLVRSSPTYFTWRSGPAGAGINHVILAVKLPAAPDPVAATLTEGPGTGLVLIDPTLTTAAFRSPSPGLEGCPALYIAEVAEPVFAIHTKEAAVASTTARMELTLDANGSARGQLQVESNGGSPLLSELSLTRNPETVRRAVAGALSEQGNQVQLVSYAVGEAGTGGRALTTLTATYELPVVLQDLASSSLLANPLAIAAGLAGLPNGFTPGRPPKPEDAVTLEPPWDTRLNTSGQATRLDANVTLQLPAGLEFSPPAPIEEKRPWVTMTCAWVARGDGKFAGAVHLEVPRGEWPAQDRKTRLRVMDSLLTGLYGPLVLHHR